MSRRLNDSLGDCRLDKGGLECPPSRCPPADRWAEKKAPPLCFTSSRYWSRAQVTIPPTGPANGCNERGRRGWGGSASDPPESGSNGVERRWTPTPSGSETFSSFFKSEGHVSVLQSTEDPAFLPVVLFLRTSLRSYQTVTIKPNYQLLLSFQIQVEGLRTLVTSGDNHHQHNKEKSKQKQKFSQIFESEWWHIWNCTIYAKRFRGL